MSKYRDPNYCGKTLEQLFLDFQFENNRDNREDAAMTQCKIIGELTCRLEDACNLLTEATTADEAEKIFSQFLGY